MNQSGAVIAFRTNTNIFVRLQMKCVWHDVMMTLPIYVGPFTDPITATDWEKEFIMYLDAYWRDKVQIRIVDSEHYYRHQLKSHGPIHEIKPSEIRNPSFLVDLPNKLEEIKYKLFQMYDEQDHGNTKGAS